MAKTLPPKDGPDNSSLKENHYQPCMTFQRKFDPFQASGSIYFLEIAKPWP